MTNFEFAAALRGQMSWLRNPDYTGALETSVDAYVAQLEKSFDEAVDPDGNAWEPIFYRETPPNPLDVSGALRDSAVADAMNGNITRDSYETDGTALVNYALDQQEGGDTTQRVDWIAKKYGVNLIPRSRKRIHWHPGRPFIGFGQEVIDKASEAGVEESLYALSEQLG